MEMNGEKIALSRAIVLLKRPVYLAAGLASTPILPYVYGHCQPMPTRSLLLCLLAVLLPLFTRGQATGARIISIDPDSPANRIEGAWRYHPGDDPAWAHPAFSDEGWTYRPAELYKQGRADSGGAFPGIGWFRTRIAIDTSLVGTPLAISMEHTGASEVFLNGKRIVRHGEILPGGKSIKAFQPNQIPVVFSVPVAGTHLLAVRYASPDAEGHFRRYGDPDGFTMTIGVAEKVIPVHQSRTVAFSIVTIFFASFFLAFCLLHFVLFLYYRAGRSNLWFALLMLGLAILFVSGFLSGVSHNVGAYLWMRHTVGDVMILTCAALSAFVNELFGKGRMRFRLLWGILLLALAGQFFTGAKGGFIFLSLALVALEAFILIIRALYMKLPGARIIGAGLLLFILFILGGFVVLLLFNQKSIILTGVVGIVFMVMIVLAILSIPISMSVYLAWSFARVRRSLARQLSEVRRLSDKAREAEAEKQRFLETRQEELEHEVASRTLELRSQKKKSDDLLLNILPAEVAEELKETGKSEARLYNHVSVLFTDFVDFTQLSERLTPAELVAEIDQCFRAFDEIITRHGLEKIKTVGDAYIAVSGLPTANERHARDVLRAAIDILAFIQQRGGDGRHRFGIRLGVHSGPVVAGIVGIKKFAYDIWGDTVNTAARMEQSSEPGRINISQATYELVRDDFTCTARGELEVKHKGSMRMYFVNIDSNGA